MAAQKAGSALAEIITLLQELSASADARLSPDAENQVRLQYRDNGGFQMSNLGLSVSFKIFLSYDKPGGCVDINNLATMCCYTDTTEIGTNNNHNIIWTQTDPNRHARNQIIITFLNFFVIFICRTTFV